MKKMLLIIFLWLIGVAHAGGQTREFYQNSLDKPEIVGATKLIGLNIKTTSFQGKALILNGELFVYLTRVNGVDPKFYVQFVTNLLLDGKSLTVREERPEAEAFIRIQPIERVSTLSRKGLADFVSHYFRGKLFRSDINREANSTNEMYCVAHELFQKGILTFLDDPTGLIGLWNYQSMKNPGCDLPTKKEIEKNDGVREKNDGNDGVRHGDSRKQRVPDTAILLTKRMNGVRHRDSFDG